MYRDPTKAAADILSEGGETGNRGQLGVQVDGRPSIGNIALKGIAGRPSRQCPIAHGWRAHRLRAGGVPQPEESRSQL
jgi:hypothetical protein